MDAKIWTVDEANALLPRLDGLVTQLRESWQAARAAAEQAADLERAHGRAAVLLAGSPVHDEHSRLLARSAEARARTEMALREFEELRVEAKDPVLGLVDFPTLRGSQVVYLCWKQGEPEITHWHSLAGGFGARQPLDELVRASGR